VYAAIVAGTVLVWGGMQATAGHDDQLRRGARVALELRAVQVAPDATIGHDRAASVRLPGTGSPAIAKLAREARGVAVTNTSCAASAAFVLPIGATLPVADCGTPAFSLRAEPTRVAVPVDRCARPRAPAALRIGRDDERFGPVAWEVPAASAGSSRCH
jgi:hypothetical protein